MIISSVQCTLCVVYTAQISLKAPIAPPIRSREAGYCSINTMTAAALAESQQCAPISSCYPVRDYRLRNWCAVSFQPSNSSVSRLLFSRRPASLLCAFMLIRQTAGSLSRSSYKSHATHNITQRIRFICIGRLTAFHWLISAFRFTQASKRRILDPQIAPSILPGSWLPINRDCISNRCRTH